jgi:hypothetical protein
MQTRIVQNIHPVVWPIEIKSFYRHSVQVCCLDEVRNRTSSHGYHDDRDGPHMETPGTEVTKCGSAGGVRAIAVASAMYGMGCSSSARASSLSERTGFSTEERDPGGTGMAIRTVRSASVGHVNAELVSSGGGGSWPRAWTFSGCDRVSAISAQRGEVLRT